MSAKLAKQPETSSLTLAHVADVKPHYYVFNATLDDDYVHVEYMDENYHLEESPLLEKHINVVLLVDFVNEHYRRIDENDPRTDYDYLKENLDQVVTEYLNKQ